MKTRRFRAKDVFHRILAAMLCIVLILAVAGCGGKETDEDDDSRSAGKNGRKPLYERGMEVVELVDEKVHSEIYLSAYGTNTITESELMERLKETDLSEPEEIYEVIFPEEMMELIWAVVADDLDDEMEDIPALLWDELEGKLLDAFVNIMNSRMGAYALATSGVLQSTYLFTDENVKKQNILYLYCYEDCYPIAVTFTFGENGAI